MGDWVGEGSGIPGKRSGNFSFKLDLDNKILIRKSHTEYPADGNKPEIIHSDLLIIYPDYAGNPSNAIYFDNEGHAINYAIVHQDNTIVLTSNKIPNVPVFRLTYSITDFETINTKFEMSKDGKPLQQIWKGKVKKYSSGGISKTHFSAYP